MVLVGKDVGERTDLKVGSMFISDPFYTLSRQFADLNLPVTDIWVMNT